MRISELVSPILDWFAKNQRDLPWRRTRDPYAVWVSEIMLQQTRVTTVIPYWERWMRELPTIPALARAREERVLKLWAGLGYYSRARNLQKAAHLIVRDHDGVFPKDLKEVQALPGIGRYTAGAICSIAFGQPAPILDGNIIRVLTRVFALRGNPKAEPLNSRLWELAAELVEAACRLDACSALNQGLMELGALVCLPSEPICARCPIAAACSARARNAVSAFPQLPPRPALSERVFRATLARRGDSILLRKRVGRVVNSGFWELPNVEATGRKEAAAPLTRIRHSITRYRMTLEVFAATDGSVAGAQWVPVRRLAALPLVNAHRRALEKLGILHATTGGNVKVPMEKNASGASV